MSSVDPFQQNTQFHLKVDPVKINVIIFDKVNGLDPLLWTFQSLIMLTICCEELS